MRFLCALLTLLAISTQAFASHAIYNSIGRQTIYGGGQVVRITSRGYLVWNPDTNRQTAIVGFRLNGMKLFSVVEVENHRTEKVQGPKGSTYTIFGKAESPGTQFAGTLLESVFARGKDRSIDIDNTGPRMLPRLFVTNGRSIVHNAGNGITNASEVTGSFTLDLKATRASNLSESHDAAVERLRVSFIAKGFTQFTPPPAD